MSVSRFWKRKREDHSRLDATYSKSQIFLCDICKVTFELSGKKLNDAVHNRRKGKAGPYCSRSCAGKATHDANRRKQNIGNIEYCRIEKSPVKETL